jgi:hypothetical protein
MHSVASHILIVNLGDDLYVFRKSAEGAWIENETAYSSKLYRNYLPSFGKSPSSSLNGLGLFDSVNIWAYSLETLPLWYFVIPSCPAICYWHSLNLCSLRIPTKGSKSFYSLSMVLTCHIPYCARDWLGEISMGRNFFLL